MVNKVNRNYVGFIINVILCFFYSQNSPFFVKDYYSFSLAETKHLKMQSNDTNRRVNEFLKRKEELIGEGAKARQLGADDPPYKQFMEGMADNAGRVVATFAFEKCFGGIPMVISKITKLIRFKISQLGSKKVHNVCNEWWNTLQDAVSGGQGVNKYFQKRLYDPFIKHCISTYASLSFQGLNNKGRFLDATLKNFRKYLEEESERMLSAGKKYNLNACAIERIDNILNDNDYRINLNFPATF